MRHPQPDFLQLEDRPALRVGHIEEALAERVELFNAEIPGTREARELLAEIRDLRRTWRQGGGNP